MLLTLWAFNFALKSAFILKCLDLYPAHLSQSNLPIAVAIMPARYLMRELQPSIIHLPLGSLEQNSRIGGVVTLRSTCAARRQALYATCASRLRRSDGIIGERARDWCLWWGGRMGCWWKKEEKRRRHRRVSLSRRYCCGCCLGEHCETPSCHSGTF